MYMKTISQTIPFLCCTVLAALLAAACPSAATAQPLQFLHHNVKVTLDPFRQGISVQNTITLPDGIDTQALSFKLNSNLRITGNTGTVAMSNKSAFESVFGINDTGSDGAPVNEYMVRIPAADANRLVLNYEGRIFQETAQTSAEYAQSFSETSGIISEQGVYLNASSVWLPDFDVGLMTFELQVEFVARASNWTAVSQGLRSGRNSWVETNPMEEVYVIAAGFTEYASAADDVDTMVFLRTPDPNLAAKYLDATERYLALYQPLLGDYPYSKFALVENFWETGYGMPSFTLLGEQVIRFPFIIDSSYPHEILHNWWGNGVYPDYASGNWSEGLTAYLADHLFQEMNGLGVEYRKDNLARYKNYVAEAADFPLSEFTSRNSAATQAVGYGKSMMLWHMLRLELGDELFLQGLRQFYNDYKFQHAGFKDIAAVFSTLSGRDLQPMFDQWVNRTGAPAFDIEVESASGGRARILFAQIQGGDPYQLTVPVALYYAGQQQPQLFHIPLSQKFEGVIAENYASLQAVVVDPYFDIFRQLNRNEIPPVIGQFFGASEIAFILPRENRTQWMRLAQSFAEGVDADFLLEEEITQLPDDRSVWILGRANRFAANFPSTVASYGVQFSADGLQLAGSKVEYRGRSTVLTARHPGNAELAIGWIHIDAMVAMPGMIEKLPHYGKYSYLSFLGAEPTNDVKGVWPTTDSPLQWLRSDLPADFQLAALPRPDALASLPPKYLPERMQRHITELTSPEMQGRKTGSIGIDRAAIYIADQFQAAGLQMLGTSFIHEWAEEVPQTGLVTLRNIIGVIPGTNAALNSSPVVLAAHYDHLGIDDTASNQQVFYGADDNASGVAVMIEVAAKLARAFSPQRSILLVAFSGEEQGMLGSKHFLNSPPVPYNSKELFAMVNLDSVGRLEGRPLQIFGAGSAYEWPFMAQGIGFTIGVPSSMAGEVIASSDHVSFLDAGIPAIHIFSGVHSDYHQSSDTEDKIDYQGLSDVAQWVEEAVVFLADRQGPLRVTLGGAPIAVNGAGAGEREASLGTVPDFAYRGQGIRISDVTPRGAAALGGLQAGDILLRYNQSTIVDLQSYSNLIRASAPGEVVDLLIRRGAEDRIVTVTLQAR
jgi:aminopeptidase N